jgi:hypothetical protein
MKKRHMIDVGDGRRIGFFYTFNDYKIRRDLGVLSNKSLPLKMFSSIFEEHAAILFKAATTTANSKKGDVFVKDPEMEKIIYSEVRILNKSTYFQAAIHAGGGRAKCSYEELIEKPSSVVSYFIFDGFLFPHIICWVIPSSKILEYMEKGAITSAKLNRKKFYKLSLGPDRIFKVEIDCFPLIAKMNEKEYESYLKKLPRTDGVNGNFIFAAEESCY